MAVEKLLQDVLIVIWDWDGHDERITVSNWFRKFGFRYLFWRPNVQRKFWIFDEKGVFFIYHDLYLRSTTGKISPKSELRVLFPEWKGLIYMPEPKLITCKPETCKLDGCLQNVFCFLFSKSIHCYNFGAISSNWLLNTCRLANLLDNRVGGLWPLLKRYRACIQGPNTYNGMPSLG